MATPAAIALLCLGACSCGTSTSPAPEANQLPMNSANPANDASAGDSATTDPARTPAEYGAIRWYTNLDTGLKLAEAKGRPVLLQFQEVPG